MPLDPKRYRAFRETGPWSAFGIHLITAVSIIKRLTLYAFTLWGRDLVPVVCISKSLYYRGFFFFLKKIYENFVGTLETVHNKKNVRTERIDWLAAKDLFVNRTATLWNSLSNDLKLCKSESHFKRYLKLALMYCFVSRID